MLHKFCIEFRNHAISSVMIAQANFGGLGERTAYEIEDRRPVVRAASAASPMALTSESRFKIHNGSPLPANSDERHSANLIKLNSEFLGRGGAGGEGKTSHHIHPFNFRRFLRKMSPEINVHKKAFCSSPHPPSPREFGLRFIEFQVNSSEFTRRGGAMFHF